MGLSIKIFFVDEDDKIIPIPLTRFDRIRNRESKESLPEYKNSRIRYAEIILEFQNRKPKSITRIIFGFLQFDSEGKVDRGFLDKEAQVAINMMPSILISEEPINVINANDRFAQKRFKNEFTWEPSSKLKQEIIKKVFD